MSRYTVFQKLFLKKYFSAFIKDVNFVQRRRHLGTIRFDDPSDDLRKKLSQ